jgi:hypothetical protein
MPHISFEESVRQIRVLTCRVDQRTEAKDWVGAVDALHALLAHPCAPHQIAADEVWDELHQVYKRLGDHDAAIAAKREAVAVGFRSQPHPDADIAECHLLAGRRDEADALFAELRARTPGDVWLYNAAGFTYAEVADHRESARWFRDGIDVALRTGDPDQVVGQLLGGLEDASTALGEAPEPGLHERVDAFVDAWRPPSGARHRWDDLPPLEERSCEHCGYDPRVLGAGVDASSRRSSAGSPSAPWRLSAPPHRDTVTSVASGSRCPSSPTPSPSLAGSGSRPPPSGPTCSRRSPPTTSSTATESKPTSSTWPAPCLAGRCGCRL